VQVIGKLPQADGLWAQMQARHWAWLYNQQGLPQAPAQLPATLSALPDYPYRSLAGWLQDDGYFSKKDDVYFVEFDWVSWLGNKMGWADVTAATLPARLAQAQRLACNPEARPLPGYRGKACKKR